MTILDCPKCPAGTKALTPVRTSAGSYWLVLTKYSSCECELSAMERARLIEQAESEAAHGNS